MTVALPIASAVEALQRGEVIAYPTEGVYGLGVDPLQAEAVYRLCALKERSEAKGFILISGQIAHVLPYLDPTLPSIVWDRVEATWPGPVTWIFPAAPHTSALLTGGRSTIAVRVSAHPTVVALTQAWGGAIISTSANRSGEPPVQKLEDFLGWKGIAGVVEGELGNLTRPTPIYDALTGEVCRR